MPKNRIGMLRKEAGLNQKELGQRLGVGQTTVSAWETGKNEPDNESMNKMAQLFEVSIGYLAGYEGDDIRRGLSQAAFEKKQERIRHKQEEDEINYWLDEEDRKFEREIERYEHTEILHEWDASGKEVQFETFKVSKLMESEIFDKKDREYCVKLIEGFAQYKVNN